MRIALARDALVRQAQQSLTEARAQLARESAHTPVLRTSADSSASSSTGLDPESAISGTDYSSQSYSTSIELPAAGGMSVGLSTSAFTSTTNSQLRTGEGAEFTYAGASVGARVYRPIGLLRDERALTEGGRWSAELGLRGAKLALVEARRRVVGDTLTRFYDALQAQLRAEIAAASRRDADELLRIAQAKFERGRLAEIEATEARVSADSAAVAQRRAESAAATALDELKSFLGLALDEVIVLSREESRVGTPGEAEEGELTARAFAQRADLRRLALNLRSAELSVRQAEAKSRPGVYLTGEYARSGEAATIRESWRDLANPSWYVGIAATSSLTAAEDRAEIDRARGGLGLARVEEELRREEIRLEVRRLAREVRDAAANVGVLRETVRIAEGNLRIRQVQFEHGLVRSIDVTQTEGQLSEARVQLTEAVVSQELAAGRLSLALGEIPFSLAADERG